MEGYCIDLFLAQLCISVPSIICDIAILCFPLPHILRLKTNLTQKIFLVGIFMLGSYVVFTSIYRFVVYLSYTHEDVPYSLAIPCAWNVIEISSGIVSSCIPTLVRCRCSLHRHPILLTMHYRDPSSVLSSNQLCPRPWAHHRATRVTANAQVVPATPVLLRLAVDIDGARGNGVSLTQWVLAAAVMQTWT